MSRFAARHTPGACATAVALLLAGGCASSPASPASAGFLILPTGGVVTALPAQPDTIVTPTATPTVSPHSMTAAHSTRLLRRAVDRLDHAGPTEFGVQVVAGPVVIRERGRFDGAADASAYVVTLTPTSEVTQKVDMVQVHGETWFRNENVSRCWLHEGMGNTVASVTLGGIAGHLPGAVVALDGAAADSIDDSSGAQELSGTLGLYDAASVVGDQLPTLLEISPALTGRVVTYFDLVEGRLAGWSTTMDHLSDAMRASGLAPLPGSFQTPQAQFVVRFLGHSPHGAVTPPPADQVVDLNGDTASVLTSLATCNVG